MSEARWTPRTAAHAAIFTTLAFLIVAIPVVATQQPRPARYGWQMYSTVSTVPEVWTEDESGAQRHEDITRFMGDGRAEIVWGSFLAGALCAEDGIRAVVVDERGARERIECP